MNPKDTPAPSAGSPRRPARTSRATRGKPAKQPGTAARKPAPAKRSAKRWIAAAHAERDPEKARAIYDAAIAQWPHSARLLVWAAGHLKDHFHDRAGAESLYRRAAAAAPDDEFIVEQLTEFLCDKPGGWKEAVRIYHDWIERDPDDPSPHHELLWIFTQFAGDYDAAERAHRENIRLSPGDSHALRTFAEFFRDIRGDPAAAARIYARAAALRDDDSAWHRKLRDDCLRDVRRNAAIERPLRRAIARNPRDTTARQALGHFLIKVRHRLEEGESFLRGTVPAELKTPAALRAIARMLTPKPRNGREWAFQIEWAALLAPFHAKIARKYAALKTPSARYFDEEDH
jgi:tetratricopeptide (TPR) repeat protein